MNHARAVSQSASCFPRPSIAILGVPFDHVTKTEVIERIDRMVATRQPHYLVTPNVDFLVQARKDIELRRILFEADLVLCDGTPLVWASKLLGNPLPERVAGADIVPLLIAVAEQRGYRLFLLGATPDASNAAVRQLRAKHPRLIIAGHYSPGFSKLLEMDHEEIRRRIIEARPDVLLVSFGCPKQEKWIAMHYRGLRVPVVIGVGATIDFLAGQVKRAPVWMQRSGTEWIFRLAQEPRRLSKRYLTDLWTFGGSICLQLWRLKLRPSHRRQCANELAGRGFEEVPGTSMAAGCSDAPVQCFRMPERIDFTTICNYGAMLEQALLPQHHCLLDMTGVTFIDSTGIGFLIKLHKRARAAGRLLVLLNSAPSALRALALMRLDHFFYRAENLEKAQQLIEGWAGEQSSAVTLSQTPVQNALAWHGEITAANAETIWDQTKARLTGSLQAKKWTIDLARVRFIDSTGLGLMVRLKKLAQQNEQTLLFTNVQPAVRNVAQISRLEEFLLQPHRANEVTSTETFAERGVHLPIAESHPCLK